ncbi:MAG: DJ-1/PfpI family protein [Calditrichaeota bacterium]|nr:DJ-1/PfpI family protein [Calditrichota bacterium]
MHTVVILLFQGVELMDFAGPAEVFIVTDQSKSFQVVTVAESREPIKTMGGVTISPDFAFGEEPKADILVVPGGDLSSVNEAGRTWLKKKADESGIVFSVCYGAFLLANTGLLDSMQATTHHWGITDLRKAAPTCKVIEGKRFVVDGNLVTSAGVTAGIDAALYIVERLKGKAAATWTATEWLEYRGEAQ